jgi:nickel-dependent lactate racemase
MKLRLDYGTDGLEVEVPQTATVIEPAYIAALPDPHSALMDVVRRPVGTPRLREFVRPGQRVGISVCDFTRPQPRRQMLEAIFEELAEIDPGAFTIFIATGTHRANTAAEIEQMLGADIVSDYRVVNHVARDDSTLRRIGMTGTGVDVLLNAEWLDCDVRITTGFVEPHFFAGFSGGPKMAAPGLAGLETVMTLHDAAHIGSPNATWAVVRGNPVHDDVREIARMSGVDFAMDVALNRDKEITAVFGGELFTEHAAACESAMRTVMQPVDEPFDVVLTTNSGFPLDQNLYQAVKGMSAAAKVVKPGGTIICAAECRDGIPDHGSYAEILASGDSPRALLALINSPGYRVPDQWQVQIQAMVQERARVQVRAGMLSDEQVRAAHFDPVDDVTAAVEAALAGAGRGARLCVLPQGPQTIPYLAD